MSEVNEDKLHAFIGKILGDLGGAASVPLVRIGDMLGLYKSLHEQGPATSAELADRTGLAERYLREWLRAQAASEYLTYDAETQRFTLPPEQAMVFVDEDSPVHLLPAFESTWAWGENFEKVAAAFRSGGGVDWGDQSPCLFCSVARFFRPGYLNNLVQNWIPALDGVQERLEQGAKVADIGCGHGLSTVIMAAAFPNSTFTGYDFHEGSIQAARRHATEHGLTDRVSFETTPAKDVPGGEYDFVTFFDCLHDMGDPSGAAAHVKSIMKPDGVCMIVEPMASDRVEENLNPVGRVYYAASTMVCVPTSLAQETGAALGAQAGETALREALISGGLTRVRRATETPFNMILEARA